MSDFYLSVSTCKNRGFIYQWVNQGFIYQWVNPDFIYQWVNPGFIYQWVNQGFIYQWVNIEDERCVLMNSIEFCQLFCKSEILCSLYKYELYAGIDVHVSVSLFNQNIEIGVDLIIQRSPTYLAGNTVC